jgi:hypothetical protein
MVGKGGMDAVILLTLHARVTRAGPVRLLVARQSQVVSSTRHCSGSIKKYKEKILRCTPNPP